jgi:uncharacterized protein with GYD domain
MATFILLTRIAPGSFRSPRALEDLEREVTSAVSRECPQVRWLSSYAVLGPHDYLDVFESPDTETATRVSTLVRTFGHAHTEVWCATPWDRFKEIVRDLPAQA